jgi:hypothetical protein
MKDQPMLWPAWLAQYMCALLFFFGLVFLPACHKHTPRKLKDHALHPCALYFTHFYFHCLVLFTSLIFISIASLHFFPSCRSQFFPCFTSNFSSLDRIFRGKFQPKTKLTLAAHHRSEPDLIRGGKGC